MPHRFTRSMIAVLFCIGVANCGRASGDGSSPVTDGSPRDTATEGTADAAVAASDRDDAGGAADDERSRPDEPSEPGPSDAGAGDPLAALSSPDVGEHCADGLSADDLTAFFGAPVGSLQGADYQRTTRLSDDRVLWTFQDAFIDGVLVHNAGLIQSGRCFTLLNDGSRSWLFADDTTHLRRWFWPLAGAPAEDGTIVVVYLAEMREAGIAYLDNPVPTSVVRVDLDATTLEVVAARVEPDTLPDLYGWSITQDATHAYLYSHCFRQFGFGGQLGFAPCVEYVKVARVPLGRFDEPKQYWTGWTWSLDPDAAVAAVDGRFVMSGNNPAQVQFDGDRFLLVEKRDDWWGATVEFGVSERATGTFVPIASEPEPLACYRSTCDTYFASWIPWREPDGSYIWSISCNLWDGAETCRNLDLYGPTFRTIPIPPEAADRGG